MTIVKPSDVHCTVLTGTPAVVVSGFQPSWIGDAPPETSEKKAIPIPECVVSTKNKTFGAKGKLDTVGEPVAAPAYVPTAIPLTRPDASSAAVIAFGAI